MDKCILRIGGEEDTAFVSEILGKVMGLDEILFIEVAYYAYRPQDPSFGSQGEHLIRCGILDEKGAMPERVRNVIRSATQVQGTNVRKMNPFASTQ